jgi:hypothetical protein
MLDSIIPVSISDFQKSIQQKIEELSHDERRPLALFAAREPEEASYFNLTDCSERPNAVRSGAKVGSEGPVSNVIRDMSAHLGDRNCLDHPSITSMRATKLRHLVFVDDFIGSGNRILGFYKWLFKHIWSAPRCKRETAVFGRRKLCSHISGIR